MSSQENSSAMHSQENAFGYRVVIDDLDDIQRLGIRTVQAYQMRVFSMDCYGVAIDETRITSWLEEVTPQMKQMTKDKELVKLFERLDVSNLQTVRKVITHDLKAFRHFAGGPQCPNLREGGSFDEIYSEDGKVFIRVQTPLVLEDRQLIYHGGLDTPYMLIRRLDDTGILKSFARVSTFPVAKSGFSD